MTESLTKVRARWHDGAAAGANRGKNSKASKKINLTNSIEGWPSATGQVQNSFPKFSAAAGNGSFIIAQ
ncbi:MAG: hypothetical protein AAGA31_09875 [Bacteroidota bacterium]